MCRRGLRLRKSKPVGLEGQSQAREHSDVAQVVNEVLPSFFGSQVDAAS